MNLKAVALASTVILFSSSPMLAQQREQPTGGPKSPQQRKVAPDPIPLEIKGNRIGESFEDFKKHYLLLRCHERSESAKECQQSSHVSLAGEATTDEICSSTDSDEMVNCLFQGVHAWFEAGKLTRVLYALPIIGHEEVCESFVVKYGKPDELTKVEGGSTCSWFRGGLSLTVSHARSPDKAKANLYVMILLSGSRPSKDI